MPNARLPLNFDITSRTASLDKDSKLVNAVVEGEDIVKRPGVIEYTVTGDVPPAEQGRGLFSWYNRIINAVGDKVYSELNHTSTELLTLSGNVQLPLSFVETANDTYLAFHDGSYLYTIPKSSPTTVTNNTGGAAVIDVNITDGGGWYDTAPAVAFTASGDTALGTAELYDHRVSNITIDNDGTYTAGTTPTITIDPPPTGTTATCQLSVTYPGGISYYTATMLSIGSGYIEDPTITFPNSGYGIQYNATGYALASESGTISVVITNPTTCHYVGTEANPVIVAPPNTTATATAVMNSAIQGPWAPGICYLDGYVYVLKTGASRDNVVTISNATPAVCTWTSHNLVAGNRVVFTTTGTLPTGVSPHITYYVLSAGLTADAFRFSLTESGAEINTSGAGSGTHTGTSGMSARIYGSASENPTSWSALNFISAASDPDSGVAIAKHLNYLVVFGQWSTEFFYNAGIPGTGSPLAVNQGAKLEIGCANGYSVATAEHTVLWVGNSMTNGKSVYMLVGLTPTRVSTKYIDKFLNHSPMTASDSVRSYIFKIAGHTLYVLTLDDINKTFVYDIDEKKWYNWTSQSGDTDGTDGTETYFKLTSYTGMTEYAPAIYLQGDHDGKIYQLDMDYYDDAGEYIYFRAVSPLVDSGSTKRKFYRKVEAVGDKVAGTLKIRKTDDDYQTWSTYRSVTLSDSRPILWQYGNARRRAWEVFSSESIPIRLKALELEFDIGETGGGQTE